MKTAKKYACYAGLAVSGAVFLAAGFVAWGSVQAMAFCFVAIDDEDDV